MVVAGSNLLAARAAVLEMGVFGEDTLVDESGLRTLSPCVDTAELTRGWVGSAGGLRCGVERAMLADWAREGTEEAGVRERPILLLLEAADAARAGCGAAGMPPVAGVEGLSVAGVSGLLPTLVAGVGGLVLASVAEVGGLSVAGVGGLVPASVLLAVGGLVPLSVAGVGGLLPPSLWFSLLAVLSGPPSPVLPLSDPTADCGRGLVSSL